MSTKRKNKGFHDFGNEENELYDSDIKGLHKLVRPVKVLSKNVRYCPPGITQVSYMMNFMIEAFSSLIMPPEEIAKLDRNALFLKVVDFVVDTTKDLESEDANQNEAEELLGAAFGSTAVITYLLPVMKQCFLDLDFEQITNEAFIAAFNILFSDMFVTD